MRNKRVNEEYEDEEKIEAFTSEMTALLNKFNAVIERSPDGGVLAVENEPNGMILMNF